MADDINEQYAEKIAEPANLFLQITAEPKVYGDDTEKILDMYNFLLIISTHFI